MKTNILTITWVICTINVFAQITVTNTDLVSVGDIIYQANDALPGITISPGNAGSNQTWDFSSLQASSTGSLLFISPIGTAYQNQYPNANLCMNNSGSFSYYDKTSTGFFMHGIGDTVFHSPALFYPLPLTYGLTISDGPILIIDNVITGPLLSLVLPDSTVSILSNGLANRADTALIKITNTTDFSVDASGVMTTPLGTFDVLRLKSIKYTNSELDIYCSDTITQIGSWITNVPFSTIPSIGGFSNNEIEYKYEWITDDASVAFLLAEIIVDSVDNIINGVSFQTNKPSWDCVNGSCIDPGTGLGQYSSFLDCDVACNSSGVNENSRSIAIYPNPTSGTFIIDLHSINSDKYKLSITNVLGKEIYSTSLLVNGTFHEDLDLSIFGKGVYFLNFATEEGNTTKKVIVE